MRVLLCVPVTTAGYQIIPDLGLGYLATALKRAGHDPVYLDCPKERMTLEGFRRWLAANGPFDLVGFKIYSLNVVNTRQCASVVREIMPEVPIIVGGPHVSGEGVTVLKTIPQITYGIAGEGEHGLPALCDWIERGNPRDMSPLEKIPGLIYTDAEGKARINERFFEPALETVGWPDWDSIQPETYPDEASGVFVWGFPSAPTVATRGCPFPCTFCSAERVTGKAVRYRAADDIVREVIYLRDTYGVKNISFLDDNLTANKKNAMAIFNGLIEAEANIHWHCPNGVRIDLLDPEMIRAMERSGCYSLACGIESGSDRILEHMRKKQTVAKLREKIELIKAHSNISLTGFFIFGYPEETREDLEATYRLALDLPLDHAHFCIYIPLVGTQSFKQLVGEGLYDSDNIDYNTHNVDQPTLNTKHVDMATVKAIQRKAYFRFYMRPRVLTHMVGQIHSMDQVRSILRRGRNVFLPSRRADDPPQLAPVHG